MAKQVFQLVLLSALLVMVVLLMGNIHRGGLGASLETLLGMRAQKQLSAGGISKAGQFKRQVLLKKPLDKSPAPTASTIDKASLTP